MGGEFLGKGKLMGGWKGRSNNGEVYEWVRGGGGDGNRLGGGSN